MNIEGELKLVLNYQWYDMIYAHIKGDEYRQPTPYWIKRIFARMEPFAPDGERGPFRLTDKECEDYAANINELRTSVEMGYLVPLHDVVTFQRAYTKNPPRMTWSIKGITVGTGRPEWGAVEGREYNVIALEEIINSKN